MLFYVALYSPGYLIFKNYWVFGNSKWILSKIKCDCLSKKSVISVIQFLAIKYPVRNGTKTSNL